MEVNCPNCNKPMDVSAYDTKCFDGQVRCWSGCKLLWNIGLRNNVLISIRLEETLYPAIDGGGGRFN